jgi:hypothetical protein
MGVVTLFKYGKRFRFAPSFNKDIWFMNLDATLWTRIAQDVKKPPLTVNVTNFESFDFNVSIWVLGVPLVPKSHDTLVELFRFTRYVERNKVHFAPFLRFH